MFRFFFAGALAVFWLLCMGNQPSMAGVAQRTCPFGDKFADGCANAPADGVFLRKNFFSYAKQSGQGSYYNASAKPSDHPPPWNVAGVDYPVGYSTSHQLKDPAKAVLPTGCTYSPTGSANGGAIVTCSHHAGAIFDYWDFSLHNCTVLDIKNSVSGEVKISNSKFVNGPNCSRQSGYLVTVESPAAATLLFDRNFVDGDAKHYPTSLAALILANNIGSVDLKYNAIFHSPARPVASSSAGSLRIAYNYLEGFVYSETDGHGEFMINVFGPTIQPFSVYSFNTTLEPNDVLQEGGTATFFVSSGQYGGQILLAQVDHNTSVTNLNAGVVTVAAASGETAYDTYSATTFQQNYVDATGSYYCFISAGNETFLTQPVFSGNINMIDGAKIKGFNTRP